MTTSPDDAIVGLVTIATGRYIEFIPPLVASARRHLVGLGPVFVLSDAEELDLPGDVRLLPWGRMEWPLPTLLRYRAFLKYAGPLETADVLLYTDADMLFVDDVDIRSAKGLIAVRHPGYVNSVASDLPYERRRSSMACVERGAERAYFCGGVQGGRTHRFLEAAATIDAAIAEDQARNITAAWHDESHWNRYLISNRAELELDASYCTPDVARTESSKILAITKNHAYFRDYDLRQRMTGWSLDLVRRARRHVGPKVSRLRRSR